MGGVRYETRDCWTLFSFFACHSLICTGPYAAAEEAVPEWTVEIARQLLMENWPDFPEGAGTTVVGYALHFVELKREAWALLSLGLKFDTNERGARGGYGCCSRKTSLSICSLTANIILSPVCKGKWAAPTGRENTIRGCLRWRASPWWSIFPAGGCPHLRWGVKKKDC